MKPQAYIEAPENDYVREYITEIITFEEYKS